MGMVGCGEEIVELVPYATVVVLEVTGRREVVDP